MAEINPLAFIGSSNDPSLTKRVTDASASSDALQRGLAQISLQGQNANKLADIDNLAARDRGIIAQGFTGNNDTGFAQGTIDNRKIKQALDRSSTFGNNASAMGVLADSVGYTPTQKGTAGQTVSSLNDLMASIPNKILAARDAGVNAAKTTAEQTAKDTRKSLELPGGVRPAGSVVTEEKGSSLKGEVKGNKPQAQAVIDDVKKQFYMRQISGIPSIAKLGIVDFEMGTDDNGKPVVVGIDAEGNEYDLTGLR